MQYHVHTADGRRLEPKSLDEIRAALDAGEFKSEGALAWTQGMPGWEPLAGILGMPPPMPGAIATDSASGTDGIGAIIPVKNGKALAAYYCSIFGLIPCVTPILGPLALVLGILGLKAVKKTPGLPGKVHAWVGIILGGFETLVIVLWLVSALVFASMGAGGRH